MFSDLKAREILVRLLEKTRANQVNWLSDPDASHSDGSRSFYVSLPQSFVVVTQRPDHESYEVTFSNKEDVVVKQMILGQDHPDWDTIQSLFDEANRIVLGWDRVLEDLEKAVSSQEKIGLA